MARWDCWRRFCICGSASGQHMNDTDAPCQGPGSDADKAQCFVAAQTAADDQPNRTYKEILSKVDSNERDALTVAERPWIRFRDAHCHAKRRLYEGGSGAPIAFVVCMEAETRPRISD